MTPFVRYFSCLFLATWLGSDAAFAEDNKPARDETSIHLPNVVITILRDLEIPAQAEGPLLRVNVREGDVIEGGEVVATIRDTNAQLELKRQQLDLENARSLAANTVKLRLAQKELDRAQAELERARKSRARVKDAISDSEFARLQLAVSKSELEIEQAEFDMETAHRAVAAHENEVALAKEEVDKRTIRSTIPGMVVDIAKPAGSWVKPGDAVVRVVQLDRLRVEAILPPQTLLKPLLNGRCVVTVELPGRGQDSYEGRVVFVRPEINPINRQVRVWAEIENRELLLRPGLSGSMTIHYAKQPPIKDDPSTPESEKAPEAAP